MNGIEKIIERIINNAELEISQITQQAQEKAAEITAEYDEAIQKGCDEILSRGKAAAEERVERLAGAALLDTKKLELSAKQDMLNRAFEDALVRLRNLPEEEYIGFLTKIAAKSARSGKEEVLLSKEDRVRFGNKIVQDANGMISGGGNLFLGEDSPPILGGLILRDGDIEINCTFESLIRKTRSEMATELANTLFE